MVLLKDNVFINEIRKIKAYDEIQDSINRLESPIQIGGTIDSQISHIVSSLYELNKKKCLIITHSQIKAKEIVEDLKFFIDKNVNLIPNKEILFYNYDAHSHENLEERLKALISINKDEPSILVSSIEGLLYRLIPREEFNKNIFSLEYGQIIERNEIIKKLLSLGYEQASMVEGKGQFSLRGGIIDIYSFHDKLPYRIELFDDEVDSIRLFDINSQLSKEKLKKISIEPANEVLLNIDYKESIERLKVEMNGHLNKLKKGPKDNLRSKINGLIEQLENGILPQGIENYLNYFYEETNLVTDYMSDDSLVFIDEPSRVEERSKFINEEFRESFKVLLEKGEVLPSQANIMVTYDHVVESIEKKRLFIFNNLPKKDDKLVPVKKINILCKMAPVLNGKRELLSKEIKNFKYDGYKIILLASTVDRVQAIKESLEENHLESTYFKDLNISIKPGQIIILQGSLSSGFEYVKDKILLLTEKEIYGAVKKKRRKKKKKDGKPIKSFRDLKVGDYVVHENHGIGKYIGVEQLSVQGAKKDYLKVKYLGEDILYVPIEQMDMVQKYIGSDGIKPRLNKLGGSEWKKTKAKVRGAIVDMANELLRLSAIRKTAKGHKFDPDTTWQKQFEDMFPYEETQDQLRCIEEIKGDMEQEMPMDRLLCGDVGYGKTEVAIRAIFKAVMDGKQVAFLVPTTILAQQHYNTLSERFKKFPVNLEVLSRFRTAKQQQKTIKELKVGNVDVIIGTHRILSKDLQFKDIGLLIIDEEQRFGVQHKEALKQLRKNVDVLTLTATPIPRTLHMSLIGLRDMSVIEDPPEDRQPVQTYVMEYNEDMIKEAILREVNRGGQVYFVFNRVRGIEKIALDLMNLIPEVKVGVAHGQMGERELENVMLDFMEKEYDVLVCTTIIETGLDISNVNTIIIYDADKMGLSQLYQLRGRVGRTNRRAYAYLTYEKDKILTEIAQKRLRAIREFTEFGSGFKIAMRDLEIRGAGNLLGGEQHGHMSAIGYDLYCKLLEETVKELKGEEVIDDIETSVEININAFIPGRYIQDEKHKLEIYKKIATIRSKDDSEEVEEEILDRFGTLPKEVSNLIDIAYMKAIAQKLGIINISETKTHAKLIFKDAKYMNPMILAELISFYKNRIEINGGKEPYIRLKYYNDARKYSDLKQLLDKIDSLQKK
jgi:transcription-repair coupling factor (superfamily II helicase)